MKFDKPVHSVSDLIQVLQTEYQAGEEVWFRGHEDASWKLIPSIGRTPGHIEVELTLIKRFQQNALPFSPQRPETDWEWLFLMQHYGAPTRLLDWSESPLVALFFAVSKTSQGLDKDGSVWCLSPQALNTLANIHPDVPIDIPCFGLDAVLDNYLPRALGQERTMLAAGLFAHRPAGLAENHLAGLGADARSEGEDEFLPPTGFQR